LITSSKPDISIGKKTWLNKHILSSELFPATLFEDVFHSNHGYKDNCKFYEYKDGNVVVVVNV